MADNDLLAPDTAAAIERLPGVKQEGVRAGNWLLKEQASELLNAPNPETLKGKRDRDMLALLVGCGLRRAELLSLAVDQIEQREGRWVIPDLAKNGWGVLLCGYVSRPGIIYIGMPMATTSYEQALRVAEALPREDQLRLIQELTEHTGQDVESTTSVMDLCGLGQELWQQRDAQEYVNGERASWND